MQRLIDGLDANSREQKPWKYFIGQFLALCL
jgi:hypothetical protein